MIDELQQLRAGTGDRENESVVYKGAGGGDGSRTLINNMTSHQIWGSFKVVTLNIE
jgi:hypothetical protein